MSSATLERAILDELRTVANNPKLTKNNIMEWSTGDLTAQEGEALYRLPNLGVNCVVKIIAKPAKK